LKDTQVEERLYDLHQENYRHQDLVVESSGGGCVLRNYIDDATPNIELVGVVLRVLKVLSEACSIKLG
jgi:hypothetical protein